MCHWEVSSRFVTKQKHIFTHVFSSRTFRTEIATFVSEFVLKFIEILRKIVHSNYFKHILFKLFEFSFMNIHCSLRATANGETLFQMFVLKASAVLYPIFKVQSQKHWTFVCVEECVLVSSENVMSTYTLHIDFVQPKSTADEQRCQQTHVFSRLQCNCTIYSKEFAKMT